MFVTIVAVMVTRKCSVGRFGTTHGAVKFKGEEVDINPQSVNETVISNDLHTTSSGFVNPVHESNYDETELDRKSVTSDATSGVASAMVDSEEEDDFFKDSKA